MSGLYGAGSHTAAFEYDIGFQHIHEALQLAPGGLDSCSLISKPRMLKTDP